MESVGVAIVVHQSSIRKLVGSATGAITLLQQLSSLDGFSCLLRAFSLFQHDCSWDSSCDFASATASFEAILTAPVLGSAWHRGNFVSQERSRLAPCMRDDRLCCRKLETWLFT